LTSYTKYEKIAAAGFHVPIKVTFISGARTARRSGLATEKVLVACCCKSDEGGIGEG
jgi:hypothetical protein